jgi:antitoxin (DNA-binding transcriptional repressor) of toxin-antitoxin stability system
MKTISLRELHNHTGKWARSVREGESIRVTDRGVVIANLTAPEASAPRKVDWANRKLVPGYAQYLKSGKMGRDSTPGISHDRTSRDNAVAGIEDDLF